MPESRGSLIRGWTYYQTSELHISLTQDLYRLSLKASKPTWQRTLMGSTSFSYQTTPKKLGNLPFAVFRATRICGEYHPIRYFARCLSLLGLVQACTWLIPSERLIRLFSAVMPSILFSDGLRYRRSFIALILHRGELFNKSHCWLSLIIFKVIINTCLQELDQNWVWLIL